MPEVSIEPTQLVGIAIFVLIILFHHSNIALPGAVDRVLRLVLVSPNMHRVHHSRKVEETNSNYSSMLTIWDRWFGNYCTSDLDKIEFGLEYDRSQDKQTLKYLLLRPFKQRKPGELPGESIIPPDQSNQA
jgi:sterol desaturase/sphingolipid hydroxylase (fatty acid hydroxylase superfamily)